MDDLVLGAVAALSPTASIHAIQDHIASRGLARPSSDDVNTALDRLIGHGQVRPKVEVDDCGRWPRRVIYYRAVNSRG
jgi:hypothetical protein